MNQREKMLAMGIGGIVLLFVAVFGLKAAFTKPLQKIDKQTAVLRQKLEKVKAERRACFTAQDAVQRFANRTFADQIDQASAKSGEMLTKQILLSGLREGDFSRLPVGPRKLRGANEIGWSVQGQGKLEDVVDLLFLLQESPYLHRIESLSLSMGDAPGNVRVGFRYLTLVIDGGALGDGKPLTNNVTLDGPERKQFEGIVARDLLRPYVKRAGGLAGNNGQPTAVSGPAALRVVSLSEWMGEPEVHIRDTTNQKTLRFKVGDELAGGTIVMVDYRPMPMPQHEGLQSYSRVILKIGNEYWAVERGQTLAEKHPLGAEQLPKQPSKL